MSLANEDLLAMYRFMLFGRILDQTLARASDHHHSSEGEEAVIVGTYYNLRKEDIITPHFRGILIPYYMRGAPLRKLLAEIMGKATGYSGGRFATICASQDLGIISYLSGVIGTHLSLATGVGLASKLMKEKRVAVVSFGDASSNCGSFHEAINFAAMFKLPVIFVCQNNQYTISMPAYRSIACGSVVTRAAAYGIPGVEVDGNDVIAVHKAVQMALEDARQGKGPALIEAKTYRVAGHFVSDQATYRSQEEVERWKQKDPIKLLEKSLIEKDMLSENRIEEMKEDLRKEISTAVQKANDDPWPEENQLGGDSLYALN